MVSWISNSSLSAASIRSLHMQSPSSGLAKVECHPQAAASPPYAAGERIAHARCTGRPPADHGVPGASPMWRFGANPELTQPAQRRDDVLHETGGEIHVVQVAASDCPKAKQRWKGRRIATGVSACEQIQGGSQDEKREQGPRCDEGRSVPDRASAARRDCVQCGLGDGYPAGWRNLL